MEKLPHTRIYEIYGDKNANRENAFANLLRDIKAANDLRIPFTVKTVESMEYRNGGNVNKGNVLSYVVVLGEISKSDRKED